MVKKALFFTLTSMTLIACTQQDTPKAPSEQTQQQAAAKAQELSEVISQGGSIRCALSKQDEGSSITYTMKGKKIRTSGMEYEGNDTKTEMISDGEYMYIWQVDSKQGIKTKLPSEADMQNLAQDAKNSIPDITSNEGKEQFESQGYTIDCKKQHVDDAEFRVPTDVKFEDTSALMQGVLDQMKGQENAMSPQQQEQMQQMIQQFQQNSQ